jgi:hypothetical protein
MTAKRRVPEPMTRTQLLEVLDDIRKRVELGDSYEGSIEYLMPGPEAEEDLSVEFMVMGAWRYGNLQGQGGMRMVGNWVEGDPWDPATSSEPPRPGEMTTETTTSVETDWD